MVALYLGIESHNETQQTIVNYSRRRKTTDGMQDITLDTNLTANADAVKYSVAGIHFSSFLF